VLFSYDESLNIGGIIIGFIVACILKLPSYEFIFSVKDYARTSLILSAKFYNSFI